MTNNNAVCSRVQQGVFLVVLLAAFGLAACGSGGGGSTSSTNPNNPNTTITTYTITASTGAGGTVTPSGATTVTQGASQSYTITPNGGYAIATLVVDGSTVATSSTHTFTNVQANHTISATFIATAPGGIVLSLVPARTSGVAPLAVFFDASGTTDIGVTTRPFHDLEYTWSFGDPGSGTWASGAQPGVSSKNSATGPVAAHVFETPGTYTVSLTAFDGTNTATTTTTITVQDPDVVFAGGNTICINASDSDFTGCPSGANTVQQVDFATAIKTYVATGKRILFKRGDTFSESTGAGIAVTGPGMIGAYGTGAKPVVQSTGNVPLLILSGSSTPTIKDWRIMDIYFDGLSGNNTDGFRENGGFDQFTLLRIDLRNVSYGFHTSGSLGQYWNSSGAPGHRIHSEYAIVDSTLIGMTTGAYAVFSNGHYFALMGNYLWDGTTTRFSQLVKAVISNNTLRNTTNTKEVIKLHAPTACDSTDPANSRYSAGCTYLTDTFPMTDAMENDGIKTFGYSQYVQIADNKMIQGATGTAPWMMTAGPQNGHSDERVLDLVFERNWIVTGTSANAAIVIFMRNATLRNNICDMSVPSNYPACFLVSAWGIEPPSDIVRIYNNTAYNSYAASESRLADIRPIATNVILQNNLAYIPNATTAQLRSSYTPGSGFIESNNSTNTQIKNTFPGWVSATPSVPADFSLIAGSYARDAGTVVPVWSDFFRTSRPQNGVIDIGAVEGP